jgi:hypothetical protein
MNFYQVITEENALEWYSELPPHLKKVIDIEISKHKDGENCSPKDLPPVYEKMGALMGADGGKRPVRPADPQDPLGGWNDLEKAKYDTYKRWVDTYNQQVLIYVTVQMAPGVQKERKLLTEALGLGGDSRLPDQGDGLEDAQAATVRWIQTTELKTSDRIAAARAMLDYVHRKVPTKQEIETKDVSAPKIDAKVLKGLTDAELHTLEKLLDKLGKSDG